MTHFNPKEPQQVKMHELCHKIENQQQAMLQFIIVNTAKVPTNEMSE